MKSLGRAAVLGAVLSAAVFAGDPGPTQWPGAVNPPYHGAAIDSPFPDNYYGADHGGSTLSLAYPFISPFGNVDHSRGVVTYYCAPFTPRGSEGVYGMDVWLEASADGSDWSPAGANGGLADGADSAYQPVNTPNPGPSPAYQFQWTFDGPPLPANVTFRVWVYVYLYNQGGGSQGNFYVGTSAGAVSSGPANDPPAIAWDPSYGPVNPATATAGQTYLISATATDDNGNLAAVQIFRNGQPFAATDGGDGWTATAAGGSADPGGTVTYSAQATDAEGLASPVISYSVTIPSLQPQPDIASLDAAVNLGQAFAPADLGGAGAGGWQFAIGGYTNFNGGATADTGTNLPGTGWIPAWTAAAAGSYSFWISHNGDATYAPSAIAGPYTLTVVDPAPAVPAPPPSPPDPANTPAPVPVAPAPTPDPTPTPSPAPSPAPDPTPAPAPTPDPAPPPTVPVSDPAPPPAPAPTLPPDPTPDPTLVPAPPALPTPDPTPIAAPPAPDPIPDVPASTSAPPPATSVASSPSTSPPPANPPPPAVSPAEPVSPSPTPPAPAAPSAPPVEIARIRFNATGHGAAVHSRSGGSALWTDPAGLNASPWPAFSPAPTAWVATGSFPLPVPPGRDSIPAQPGH